MKKIYLGLFLLIYFSTTQAQTIQEVTQQNKTALAYLIAQIGALRAYAEVVEQGFAAAGEGLALINQIKEGDKQLHGNQFRALITIRASIKLSKSVQNIDLYYTQTLNLVQVLEQRLAFTPGLTLQENRYVRTVIQTIRTLVEKHVQEASALLQESGLALTDEERLKRLHAEGANLKFLFLFTRYLKEHISVLMAARLEENKEGKKMKTLYGID